jgi:hypothetical protein
LDYAALDLRDHERPKIRFIFLVLWNLHTLRGRELERLFLEFTANSREFGIEISSEFGDFVLCRFRFRSSRIALNGDPSPIEGFSSPYLA